MCGKSHEAADHFVGSWRCFCNIIGLPNRLVSIFDAFCLVFRDIFKQIDLTLAILNIQEFLPHDIAVRASIVSSGNSDEIVAILLPVRQQVFHADRVGFLRHRLPYFIRQSHVVDYEEVHLLEDRDHQFMGLEEDIRKSHVSQVLFQDPNEMSVMFFVWLCGGKRLELCEVESVTTMLPVDRGGFDGLIETYVHMAVAMFSVVVHVRAEEGPFDCAELNTVKIHAINF